MNEPFQVSPGPLYTKEKPVRDPEYRRFIKRLPCLGCLKSWGVDPAHTGPHGIGQKASDLSCIPLCRRCHQEFDADPQGFAETHKIDIAAEVAMFNHFWFTKIRKKAA